MLSRVDGFAQGLTALGGRQRGSRGLKRATDLVVAVVALVFLLPAIVAIAVALYVHDGRPIVFRQKRVGAGGKEFEILKFRSMCRGADSRLAELLTRNAAATDEWKARQKLRHDPRVHRLGSFLRQTSLDEIPQFLNVLRGEMSIVGPRPIIPEEIVRYGDKIHCYISLTPGITGLWQVSGRSGTSYETRVNLDAEYYQKRSMLLDLKIMWRTIIVLLFARNGY